MGPAPALALACAALAAVCALAGWPAALVGALALGAVLLALLGFARPGDDRASGRAGSAFALAFAALPLLQPTFAELRLARLEAARAAEIVPLQEAFDRTAAEFAEELLAFAQAFGRFPSASAPNSPPFVDPAGEVRALRDAAWPDFPADPFDRAARGITVRGAGSIGALVVAAGPEGVARLPAPQLMAILDAEPCHPLAPFAWIGRDPRGDFFDPAAGALSAGDVVHWASADGRTRAEDWQELDAAWDAVARREADSPHPASALLALAAEALEDEYPDALLALAAASRAAVAAREPADRTRAMLLRARALYALGHYRRAADSALAALAADANDSEAHWWAAASLWRGGRPNDARRHLDAAVQTSREPGGGPAGPAWRALRDGQTPPFPRGFGD